MQAFESTQSAPIEEESIIGTNAFHTTLSIWHWTMRIPTLGGLGRGLLRSGSALIEMGASRSAEQCLGIITVKVSHMVGSAT